MANYDCHEEGSKARSMVVFYCHSPIVQMRKCCEAGKNLNLR